MGMLVVLGTRSGQGQDANAAIAKKASEAASIYVKTGEREERWRLLLPGASEPRLTELNPSGL